MATILFNGLASTAGGGITYLRNVLPRLARWSPCHKFLALVPPEHLAEYRLLAGDGIELDTMTAGNSVRRMWWEQTGLRSYIIRKHVDAIIALGNFALFGASVPQVLFNRNDVHFSREFERDLRSRGLFLQLAGNRVKRWLAQLSMRAADVNIAPTAAFAERLRSLNGRESPIFEIIPFGFDPERFKADRTPLAMQQLEKLRMDEPLRRLLYVSHYNYFRNFETLIRALPHIPDSVQLVLTTDIRRGAIYGGYDATAASDLIDELGVRGRIAMLGAIPHSQLHHLYELCDAFACPSYSESFGHPLVEAMASGLPIAAADLPVHREVCGEAAIYFSVFDERALAAQCARVLTEPALAEKLKAAGYRRLSLFSWDEHVLALVALVERCIGARHN